MCPIEIIIDSRSASVDNISYQIQSNKCRNENIETYEQTLFSNIRFFTFVPFYTGIISI